MNTCPHLAAKDSIVMRCVANTCGLVATLVVAGNAFADASGYDALVARLGSATPTGAGIGVLQMEATVTPGGVDYSPDAALAEFAGKTLTRVNNPYATSSHANYVATWLYGANSSMAKGVTNVWVYNVNNWINENLKINSTLPIAQPNSSVRVQNNSWIGSFGVGNEVYDREAVRRMDYIMYRDGMLAVNGENNGAGSVRYPMMGDCFNGLSVGRLDLQHSAGLTGAASDTPGRMKPDIIASGQATSYSTPVVGSAAAVLFQQAQSSGSLAASLSAMARAQLVKTALLAGATRDASWSNQAPQSGAQRGITAKPLDPVRGSGALNIDNAHKIISLERNNGASSATAATRCGANGFGSFTMSASQNLYWRFRVDQTTPSLDFVVSWPRVVTTSLSYTLANLDLKVYRGLVDATTLISLQGDAGSAFVGSGNVWSQSTVDNVEIIHMNNVVPGEYVVELARVDSAGGAVQVSAGWQVAPAGFGRLGDFDNSGIVDSADLGRLLGVMGTDDPTCDVNLDGTVDSADVGSVLTNFG